MKRFRPDWIEPPVNPMSPVSNPAEPAVRRIFLLHKSLGVGGAELALLKVVRHYAEAGLRGHLGV